MERLTPWPRLHVRRAVYHCGPRIGSISNWLNLNQLRGD
jgi:hypothetical protein